VGCAAAHGAAKTVAVRRATRNRALSRLYREKTSFIRAMISASIAFASSPMAIKSIQAALTRKAPRCRILGFWRPATTEGVASSSAST
jgi:hypothetical protein